MRAAVELKKFPSEIEAAWTEGDLLEFAAWLKITQEAERRAIEEARARR